MTCYISQLLGYKLLEHKRIIIFTFSIVLVLPVFFVSNNFLVKEKIDENQYFSKLISIILNSNHTLCSYEANHRGNHQKVISLSIFGNKENSLFVDNKSTEFLSLLISEANTLFPEWILRVYADQETIFRLNLKFFSNHSLNVDICNVNELPTIGNVGKYLPGKLWRFLPTLDPMVDFTSSRDLDSPLTERERTVVDVFINSSYLLLSMRDHPMHGIAILGGLWTAAQYRNRPVFLRQFSILLDQRRAQQYSLKHDQTLLNELLWPHVKNQTLAFDSYTCEQFTEADQRPYPTQRPSRNCHLGCVRPCCDNSPNTSLLNPCPVHCRPQNHSDWLYC